jgi:hypothetical protein
VTSVANAFNHVSSFEDLTVKEPQCAHRLIEQDVRSALLIAQPDLIRNHVLGPELIGRCPKVTCEVNDGSDVRPFSSR